MDQHYTPEQLEQLEARAEEVGPDRIQQVQEEWNNLFGQFRAQMEAGSDPLGPETQSLAAKAMSLIEEFTGGDPGILASLDSMYQNQGKKPLEGHGYEMSTDLWAYYGTALRAFRNEGG